MFFGNTTLLVIFVLGVIALFVGMGFRDRNPGIVLMGIGLLGVLVAVIQKAIETFG
jgi:lipopolysaccharide export LptBFGC system permease protein LptF